MGPFTSATFNCKNTANSSGHSTFHDSLGSVATNRMVFICYSTAVTALSIDIVPNQFPKVLIEILSFFFLPLTLYAQLAD
jgi:hypothetical protein